MSKHRESFTVLSIDREDITHAMGYDLGTELTDYQMQVIAGKLGDAIVDLGHWSILADVVESWLEYKLTSVVESWLECESTRRLPND